MRRQNFLLWLLPMLGVGKWLSMKYEKQLAKLMKKYRKWEEARAPPKPLNSEPVPEGETNDWIDGAPRPPLPPPPATAPATARACAGPC